MLRNHDMPFGRIVRSVCIDGFMVSEVAYPPNSTLPMHTHPFSNVSLVLSGVCEERTERTCHVATPCSAVFKPAGQMHSNRFGPSGARLLLIRIAEKEANTLQQRRAYGWMARGSLAAIGLAIYRSLTEQRDVCTQSLQLADQICELLAQCEDTADVRESRTPPAWLDEARELLHRRACEPIRVRELAIQIGVHPVYLARAFRRFTGTRLTAYRRHIQAHDAALRLAESDANLASIAVASGFADQSHLCRAFRSEFGMTPGRFRGLIRG